MIHIISVGKPDKSLLELEKHYQKMITWKLVQTELQAKINPLLEAKAILKHLKNEHYKIVLDIGKNLDSLEFSKIIKDNLVSGRSMQFVIGGAFGLDESVVKAADFRLSFSKMTFPHKLVRVLLLEQIYRAQSIIAGSPYHK